MNSRLHDKPNIHHHHNSQQSKSNTHGKLQKETQLSNNRPDQCIQKIPNNNINININFSVQEKTNCFVGKKIDNCIEITNPSALRKSGKNMKSAQRQKYAKDGKIIKQIANQEKSRYKPTKQSISIQALKKPLKIRKNQRDHLIVNHEHQKYGQHELQQFYQETPDKHFRVKNQSEKQQSYGECYESKSKSKSRSKSAVTKYKKSLNNISSKNLIINENKRINMNQKASNKKLIDYVKHKKNILKDDSPEISQESGKSESIQRSKSRSNSKTQTKRYNKFSTKRDSESKTLLAFQNSGIKKHFINNNIEQIDNRKQEFHMKRNKSQVITNKSIGMQPTNHKKMSQEEFNSIQAYMNQKKKRQKRQRLKAHKLEKQFEQRKKQQLRKAQQEQRKNASKKVDVSYEGFYKKKSLSNKSRKKLSIPNALSGLQNGQEEFDEDTSYNKIREQAEMLIYSKEPSFGSPIKLQKIDDSSQEVWLAKSKSEKVRQGQSNNKQRKTNVNQNYNILIRSYCEGKLQVNRNRYPYSQYLIQLQNVATTIQRFYRGYIIRKRYAIQINNLHGQVSSKLIKFEANLKNSNFWKDSEGSSSCNSIIKIENQSSLQNSQQKAQKSWIQKSVDKDQSENKFVQEIQLLRKNLIQQSQKFKLLELENEQLKRNFQRKQQKQEEIQSNFKSQELSSLNQQQHISEALKLQKQNQKGTEIEQIQSKQFEPKNEESSLYVQGLEIRSFEKGKQLVFQQNKSKRKQLKIFIENGDSNAQDGNQQLQRQHLKKIMESYTCSPKNSSFQLSLSRAKDQSILQLFHKKQLKLQNKFHKKTQIFEKMLSEHLVSPRTYNVKIIDLQQAYQKERKRIEKRKKEAKRVSEYLKTIQKQVNTEQQQAQKDNDIDNISQQNSQCSSIKKSVENCSSDLQESQQLNNKKWIHSIQQIDREEIKKQSNKHEKHNSYQEQQIQQQIVIEPLQHSESSKSKAQQIFNRIRNINEQLGDSSQQHSQQQLQLDSCSHSQSQKFQAPQQNQNTGKQEAKGFQTNLTFVKQYCIGLCQFIRAHDHFKQEFWKNIFSPIYYDNFEMLKAYRTTSDNQNCSSYNSHRKQFLYPFFKQIFPKVQAIPHQVFEQFNCSNNKLAAHDEQNIRYLQQCYLESILDAFNESLDHQRPGSIHGQQLPWSADAKHLKNLNQVVNLQEMEAQEAQKKFDQFFGVAIARLIQWGSCLCGFIPQSLELQPDQKIQFDEEQINHVRQTRMALMLQRAIKQDDINMVNSQLQVTQVRLALGTIIFEELVNEALEDMLETIL